MARRRQLHLPGSDLQTRLHNVLISVGDAEKAQCMYGLGRGMQILERETITLPTGHVMTTLEVLLEADQLCFQSGYYVRHGGPSHVLCGSIARTMQTDAQRIVLADGREFSRKELYAFNISHASYLKHGDIRKLVSIMADTETIAFPGGSPWTKQALQELVPCTVRVGYYCKCPKPIF